MTAIYPCPVRLPALGRPGRHSWASSTGCVKPGHILVVDDDRAIADFVAEALRDEGYAVRVTHDGTSALEEVRAEDPALLLLDIAMPELAGDAVLHELRESGYRELPIIVMTASLWPERFLAEGATAILPKPFDVLRLLEQVADYLPSAVVAR